MHKPFIGILSGLVIVLQPEAGTLSEQKALLAGLENRYEIRILRIENRIDSLNVETARSQWLPQVSASTGVSYLPHDSTGFAFRDSLGGLHRSTTATSSSIAAADSLSIAQHLPGGGVIGGGFGLNYERSLRGDDSTLRSSSAAVSYTQPLLRDAWRFDPVAHSVRIARLDNQQFTLEQKKRLLSYCSDIRTRYWKLYEAQSLASFYKSELAYARERMTSERARHSIGTAAPLDTLDAKLALINATARLHDAESDELQAREELAFYAGIAVDEAVIDSTAPIECASLPPPDSMLWRAEQFDPQLRIFDVAAERLELTRVHTRNSLLPRVDLNASWNRSLSESSASGSERFYGNSVIGLIASYAFPVKPRRLALAGNAASAEKNSLDRKRYREQLRLGIRELDRSWERERRGIEIAAAARQIAGQTLAATREGFSAGTVDRLSLDKAENDFRSACIELLRKQLLMKHLEIIFDEMTGLTLFRLGVDMK
ncbi:MAG: TolC family protein [Chitinispirillaceae bacterium]|nr:TolC family protein [Chitinispirillaceae bacterium]